MYRQLAAALLVSLAFTADAAPAGWIDPIKFDGSPAQKQAVLNFIRTSVRHEYCAILGQCSHTSLRMHEEEELRAFKKLAAPKTDKTIFRQVYKDYCTDIGDCSYATLELMYRIEVDTAEKTLEW